MERTGVDLPEQSLHDSFLLNDGLLPVILAVIFAYSYVLTAAWGLSRVSLED